MLVCVDRIADDLNKRWEMTCRIGPGVEIKLGAAICGSAYLVNFQGTPEIFTSKVW